MEALATVLSRTDSKPAGKTIALHKGGLDKRVSQHTGHYHAETIALSGGTANEILAAWGDVLGALTADQTIVLGHVRAMGAAPFAVVPQSHFKNLRLDPTGVHVLRGVPTIARLKPHFSPSRLLLLDFDPDPAMPEELRALDTEGRWALLCAAFPEFQGAARLIVPSGSGRVLMPDGRLATSTAGEHTYLLLDQAPTAGALDDMRASLEVRLWAAGLGYRKPAKNGAELRRALVDSSVWCAGREVFAAPPKVLAPLTLAPLTARLIEGTTARALELPGDATRETFTRATGARVKASTAGGASIAIDDTAALRLHTKIETEAGTMTVREFLRSKHSRLRCQATFRASTSWAGILRKTAHGVTLHDVGSNVSYHLHDDPAEVPGDLAKALTTLGAEHEANAHGLARALLARHRWRAPIQLDLGELAERCCAANRGVDAADLRAWAALIADQARRAALEPVTLDGRHIQIRTAGDLAAILREVRRTGGVHVIKAPHGLGKTQHVLRPLALGAGSEGVLAIAPRVSLVSDIAQRLDLAHYQVAPVGERHLAICINSIVNPRHQAAVESGGIVLVDEIGRVVRECHDPHGTMKDPRAVWRQLIASMGGARLAVGVDADLDTLTVKLLAEALGRPVTVWELGERPRETEAAFLDHRAVVAQALKAIEAGERVWIAADSAAKIAGLAAELRARFPERRIVAIHAAAGLDQTGTAEVGALLRDINGQIASVDILLTSPAVESGVSLETAHFEHHAALYGGHIEPAAFNQMLGRDRTARRWNVGIVGRGFHNLPADRERLLNGLSASARKLAALDGRIVATEATAYDADCIRAMAQGRAARNAYASALWHLLEHRGWRVSRAADDDDQGDGKALLDAGKDALDDARVKAVMGAADVSDFELARLREAHRVSPDQSAQIARADVRTANGKPRGELTGADVERWLGGRLEQMARRLEDALAPAGASDRDLAEALGEMPLSARHHDGARRWAVRALWRALGLNPRTGEGVLTAETARAAWAALKDSSAAHLLELAGIARFDRAPAYPVRWAGDVLAKFGLWLEGTGHHDRAYQIAAGEKRNRRTFALMLPGLGTMAECLARRCAYKDSLGACARAAA